MSDLEKERQQALRKLDMSSLELKRREELDKQFEGLYQYAGVDLGEIFELAYEYQKKHGKPPTELVLPSVALFVGTGRMDVVFGITKDRKAVVR